MPVTRPVAAWLVLRRGAVLLSSTIMAGTASLAAQAGAQGKCRAGPDAPRLDHVVLAVHSLDSAAQAFQRLGFRLKTGRLHPDNLLNRHVKFRDGRELELMTLQGPPLDSNARDYTERLALGDGGAYVALLTDRLDQVARAAETAGLRPRLSSAGNWRFLGFPSHSDAGGVFFGNGWTPPADPDSVFAHPNGAMTLAEAWVEGGPGLASLLEAIGATACGPARLPDGRQGERWALGAGSLVLLPKDSSRLPRPVAAVIATRPGAGGQPGPLQVVPGFWLILSPPGPAPR